MKSKGSIVLKFLIENKNEELNILNVSKGLKMDYKNVYSIIKRLNKKRLVDIETFGRANRIKLKKLAHPLIFEAEVLRRKEILKNKNIAVMLSSFERSIKSRLYVLLLFGSYAKKTQTKGSDIDILFICPDGMQDSFEKDASRVARSLPLNLHPLVFSEKQFIEMIGSKERNVVHEVLENNIILYGIEQYYSMVNM